MFDLTELHAAARRLAQAFLADAGETATTWLRITPGVTETTHPADSAHFRLGLDFHEAQSELVDLLRSEAGPLVVELVVHESGSFDLACTADLDSATRVVLDQGFRLPGHPLPGVALPPAARNSGEPTDPEVLSEISLLFNEFVQRYAEIKGRPPELRPGYTEAEIAAAEDEIGARLPEDLRALYRMTRDDGAETGLLGGFSPYPLDVVVEWCTTGDPGSLGWNDGPFDDAVVFEPDPPGAIKRVSRNDWWITFGTDFAMNNIAVDLDPGEQGSPGQVIEYGRDVMGPPVLVADSVTAMLTEVVESLREEDFEDEDPESDYLESFTGFGGSGGGHERVYHDFGDRDLAEVVSRIDDGWTAQCLYLNDAEQLDLAALAPLHDLRELSINRASAVHARIGDLPALERAAIEAERIDLAGLAGHPLLWDLKLTGTTDPIDIDVLRTLPSLTRLDLSAVEVVDPLVVADLPGLRVLILNAQQWDRLRDADRRPAKLAAAERVGTSSLRETAEWCEWLAQRPFRLDTCSRVIERR
ncbi:SMI1/KNR4 family protein [Saccharopolyspora shandongensis]|uniref:SMI1/KNR4 family protein n=1 Tax=Saccharopolyspora shandongensis TaxID=418495 RepID=UPI00342BF918